MRLTKSELQYLKKCKILTPKTFPYREKTIGELIEAACPEPQEESLLTYEEFQTLNTFALQSTSLDEWSQWMAQQSL